MIALSVTMDTKNWWQNTGCFLGSFICTNSFISATLGRRNDHFHHHSYLGMGSKDTKRLRSLNKVRLLVIAWNSTWNNMTWLWRPYSWLKYIQSSLEYIHDQYGLFQKRIFESYFQTLSLSFLASLCVHAHTHASILMIDIHLAIVFSSTCYTNGTIYSGAIIYMFMKTSTNITIKWDLSQVCNTGSLFKNQYNPFHQ